MKKYVFLFTVMALAVTVSCGVQSSELRSDELLETGWKFHRGEVEASSEVGASSAGGVSSEVGVSDASGVVPHAALTDFDDSAWEDVVVPHDWAIYGPFDKENDLQNVAVTQNFERRASLKTGRTGGLPYVGVGWYRRTFTVPEGKCATLIFDGAMSEARVYINGQEVCFWPYGYSTFSCDVTEFVHAGENVLAVRLENRPNSSRWYPGAGLYRNVHLVLTESVRVPVWGVRVTTPKVSESQAVVVVETEVESASGRQVEVVTKIVDSEGRTVGKAKCDYDGKPVTQNITVLEPQLWSPESPALYTAVSKIYADGELTDVYPTRFGIRSIEFSPERGFCLNGVPRKFQGVCNHHDLGPLGAAVNVAALRHQLLMLKDMGCDAVRTSHNLPAPELVELCDEMGLMMMIEPFDEWDIAKCANGYHRFFDEWAERDMVNMVRHYRNNPSVVIWSIGNEVPTQCSPDGRRVAESLRDICHREDPTRPVTCGMDQVDCVLSNGFAAAIDVPGFNYRTFRYLEAYDKLPQGYVLGSETASTVSSRGVYKHPAAKRFGAVDEDHQSSSYDLEACKWANIPDVDFALAEDYDWTLGQFVWTGFDYLGEPSPYDTDAWPNHSSMFGIIDLASIPKDRFFLYRSVWNRAEPTLHILPHWNWKGHEGESIPVFVYTSYPEAELFLNGVSLGRQRKRAQGGHSPVPVDFSAPSSYADFDAIAFAVAGASGTAASSAASSAACAGVGLCCGEVNEPVETRYRLMWYDVAYEPGELKVVAYDDSGAAVAEQTVRTAGQPDHIELECSYCAPELKADGKDLAYITVKIVDKDGNLCPHDSRLLQFEVTGAAKYRASANGDPTCLDIFHEPRMHVFNGMATVIVQSDDHSGTATLTVTAPALPAATLTLRVR